MASFYTTVSRIGQLAGGLDVAQKTKEKEIATKNEQIRQFNLGLAKDYDIAKMKESGLDTRNLRTNLSTITSAKIKANNKGGLQLNDFGNLDDVISNNIVGLGILKPDYFDNDGNIKSGYNQSLGTLRNIIRDKIINSGVQNDMGAIQTIITETVNQLSPSISPLDNPFFGDETGGKLGFGGEVGKQIQALKNQYQKPETDQPTFIKNLRQRLMQEYKSAPLVNQIINSIIAG
jgi:hypothetical protein